MSEPRTTLPRYLATAYTLLVVYASLHPFTGWRDAGAPWSAFLIATWPRYWTVLDLLTNALAYLPLGFIWVPALQRRCGKPWAVVLACALGICLSLSMETLQNYLPSRVPSNVDFGCNALGACLGAALGARWGAALLDGGRLHALRTRLVGDGAMTDAGLVLLSLWLLTQLNPETLLFGNGDLRSFLGFLEVPAPAAYTARQFSRIETAVVASNTLAVALLAGCLLRGTRLGLTLALMLSALCVRSLSMMVLMDSVTAWSWLTPGGLTGLAIGGTLWLAASRLPRSLRQSLAALSLLLATALVNLAPANPYFSAILQVWQQGHFLNFNGLTRLTSALWPFLALPWLMALRQGATTPPTIP